MRTLQDGDFLFAADVVAFARAHDEESAISGCGVTHVSDLTVNVAAGRARFRARRVPVASQNIVLVAAEANPRYDLIVVAATGTARAVKGTAAASPKAPDVPADEVLLAVVRVDANALVIGAADIFDARMVDSGEEAPMDPIVPPGGRVEFTYTGDNLTGWTVYDALVGGNVIETGTVAYVGDDVDTVTRDTGAEVITLKLYYTDGNVTKVERTVA